MRIRLWNTLVIIEFYGYLLLKFNKRPSARSTCGNPNHNLSKFNYLTLCYFDVCHHCIAVYTRFILPLCSRPKLKLDAQFIYTHTHTHKQSDIFDQWKWVVICFSHFQKHKNKLFSDIDRWRVAHFSFSCAVIYRNIRAFYYENGWLMHEMRFRYCMCWNALDFCLCHQCITYIFKELFVLDRHLIMILCEYNKWKYELRTCAISCFWCCCCCVIVCDACIFANRCVYAFGNNLTCVFKIELQNVKMMK